MDADLDVLRIADIGADAPASLLRRYGIELQIVADTAAIPGTFWGAPEAGIVRNTVLVRRDTPVHSLLHETCHIICASAQRRSSLETDAGSDYLEEVAVCYLQVVLADALSGVGRDRLMQDMDSWGYSFRLGSSRAWFMTDAADARGWLERHGLLTDDGKPSFRLRK